MWSAYSSSTSANSRYICCVREYVCGCWIAMIRPSPTTVRAADEGRRDLGRVVRVVVEDADAALDAVQLEAADRALESLDGADGGLEVVARA